MMGALIASSELGVSTDNVLPKEPVVPWNSGGPYRWGCCLSGRREGRDFRCFYSHNSSGRKIPLSLFYT